MIDPSPAPTPARADDSPVAPYVRHEAFEETLASAASPVWNPSHNVKIFLRSPGTQSTSSTNTSPQCTGSGSVPGAPSL